MAWMQCRSCWAKFAVGLLRCPQCTAVSEMFAVPEEVIEAEQEATMPKITVGDGASNAADAAEEPSVEEVAEEAPAADDATNAHPEPDTAAELSSQTADTTTPTSPAAAAKRAAKKAAAVPEPTSEG